MGPGKPFTGGRIGADHNLAAGAGSALGGVILFGPLNFGWGVLTLAGGLFTGLLFAAVTARQQIYALLGDRNTSGTFLKQNGRISSPLPGSGAPLPLL